MSDNKSKALAQLVTTLGESLGDNLLSVVLYGASAIAEADHRSDHNVLVVLRHAELADLKRCAASLRDWVKSGQPPPVIFTTDEITNAADVFPIEFLQMEKARKVLFGSDPFESLKIQVTNLRHQLEYDLRTKFIQLRRLYVERPRSQSELTNLMIDSFGSFAALFRAVLILKKQEQPLTKAQVTQATIDLLQLDATPFNWILEQKSSPQNTDEAEAIFGAYLRELERVIDVVDNLP